MTDEKQTTFYFIRHGQSTGNENPHIVCGRSNHQELTQTGIGQGQRLNARLHREKLSFDQCLCSPATRALKTAEISFAGLEPHAPIQIDHRLQEMSQGDWEGQLRADMYTPEVMQSFLTNGGSYKAPNGESQLDVETRMMDLLHSYKDTGGRFGVVTHAVAIILMLRHLMDAKREITQFLAIENTSLTVLQHQNDVWRIKRINDHAHLL